MDFTIYKVKSDKILRKSKDLSGFQGEILRKIYRVIEVINVNGLNHTNQTITFGQDLCLNKWWIHLASHHKICLCLILQW